MNFNLLFKQKNKTQLTLPIHKHSNHLYLFFNFVTAFFNKRLILLARIKGYSWSKINNPFALKIEIVQKCRKFLLKFMKCQRGFLGTMEKNRQMKNQIQHASKVNKTLQHNAYILFCAYLILKLSQSSSSKRAFQKHLFSLTLFSHCFFSLSKCF